VNLPERLLELQAGLARRRVPHAFGGAIALAYWTLDPRGTNDIDLNVFLHPDVSDRALRALPGAVQRPDDVGSAIARDGQVRLWWEDVPIDLFFSYLPIHDAAARHRTVVRFAGGRIPILGPIELAAFKVMFDRTRDWADIEAMITAGTLDLDELRSALASLLPGDDSRFARLAEAERRAVSDPV
jgi:hypothetical protein